MKGILFNGEMVRAILEGRKTQTRRVVKPQPQRFFEVNDEPFYLYDVEWGLGRIYPRYQPGDILWVKETWRIGAWCEEGLIAVDYKADNFARKEWIEVPDPERFERYWIQSTDEAEAAGLKTDKEGEYHWKPGEAPTRWRPSIFMPREAARIFLKVTGVRVERVWEMTGEDAIKEGVNWFNDACGFAKLWDSINGKKYPWASNPWVWVYEFERVEK